MKKCLPISQELAEKCGEQTQLKKNPCNDVYETLTVLSRELISIVESEEFSHVANMKLRLHKIQVSLTIRGGYVPDKFQTTNTKTGSLSLNYANLASK